MTLTGIAARNIGRNKLRTTITVIVVAVSTLFFIMLRTVVWSWTSASEFAKKDRIATRHKVSFVMQLPKRYAEEIAQMPGVTAVSYANWFGGKDPRDENDFFATIATDPASLLKVYPEIKTPEAQKEAWLSDRRGALIGDALAKKKGWKVGDKITLAGSIYPGNWDFNVSGIYTTTTTNVDRSTVWFHWDYLNESLPERRKDMVGWIVSNISDPGASGRISKEVDAKFEERDLQTITMSEAALNQSFLGMFSAILKAIDLVSVVMIAIMGLIVGNTIAMGVRERTNEYGVLRAIGFLPKHVAQFVLGEALVIGIVGGLLGLALGYPFVNFGVGRFLEENMGQMFPQFRVQPQIAALAFGLALLLAVVSAILPARRAAKLQVVESLRRVG
ncbi:MAG TPA: FtsX-like permease family protein [Polyangiaceae bacterium]|nr:FtsX-like permease family protein [Polyangiaceae bacterium]